MSCLVFALGCGSAAPELPPQSGSVVLTWSVGAKTTPQACDAVGAGTFRVVLSDWEGRPAGTWTADCAQFATTVTGLAPDEYTGHAELLDPGGTSCVPPVDLADVTIVGSSSETLAVDFTVRFTVGSVE